MTEINTHNLLVKTIAQFGAVKQVEMVNEEVGELLQAINKLKRLTLKGESFGTIPQKHHSIKYCLAYWNLCSEIADVKILMQQMENIFSKEAIDLSIDRKLIRLEERLEKNTY